MPTYRNTTNATIAYNGAMWTPEETKPVSFFVPDEKGLAKISDEPIVPGEVLASGTLTLADGEAARVYIPDCNAFVVTITASAGAAQVRQNGLGAVAVPIDTVDGYKATLHRSKVEALYVTGDSGDESTIKYVISRCS